MSVSNNSIVHLSLKIQSIYKLLKLSFGPFGKSVLFEKSGKVFTTKDGSEILSLISIEDPVAMVLINDVASFGKHHGEGVKLLVIFISEMLSSLCAATAYCFANDNQRRIKMIECLINIRQNIFPVLFDQLFLKLEYFYFNNESKRTVKKAIFSFFITKFPSSISNMLANLLISFIYEEKSMQYLPILKNVVINPCNYFIEIPGLAIHQSKIVQGFIITRSFKYLHCLDSLQSCSFVLWSIDLEENEASKSFGAVEIDSGSSLADFYCYKHRILSSYLKILKERNVSLILSSAHFPEWAIARCMNKGISVIDMIGKQEFDVIKLNLRISEVSLFNEIPNDNNIGSSSFNQFRIGDKRYVKMQLALRQVILCGPTLSQTKQYFTTCHKALKYLYYWILDSNHEIPIIKTTIDCHPVDEFYLPGNQPLKMYYVPSKGYIYFLLAKCLEEYKFSKFYDVEKKVVIEMFTIPLKILHEQRNNLSDGTFLQHWNTMELNMRTIYSSSPETIENPFLAFKILSQVTLSLTHLLKIEHVIYTSVRLKSISSNKSGLDDDDDDDDNLEVHL